MKITLSIAVLGILFFSCSNEKAETTQATSKPIYSKEDSIKLAEKILNELVKAQKEEKLNSKKTESSVDQVVVDTAASDTIAHY